MTSLTGARWRSTLETRLEARSDDRGAALLTALMFMLLATALSLVLLTAILSQAVPAYTAQKNTRTVYAAQAGLQSALAIIRSAEGPIEEGHMFGEPKELPCNLSGRVSADGTGAMYSVTVQYFTSDPTTMTRAERDGADMVCTTGVATPPRFAYISSSGTDAAIPGNPNAAVGNRTLSAIYSFRTTNLNIPGGLIFAGSGSTYCLQAVSAKAGSKMKFVTKAHCTKTPLQLWTYTVDYQLKLASSGTPGLCITGPTTPIFGLPEPGDATLGRCKAPTDSARWNQLWSWTGDYTWQSQKRDNSDVGSYYLSPGSFDNLRVSLLRGGNFSPSLEIGAGAASYETHQLVNYLEFGRCADVTKEDINFEYMISYPCKQDPSGTGANLRWNHKWYYTEPDLPATISPSQPIYVIDDSGRKRCLTAPAASGVELTFEACTTSARQEWKRTKNTGNYSGSYLLINQGKCLFADSSRTHTDGTSSRLRLKTCDGSLAQKWNAPPIATESTVDSYSEVPG